MSAKPRPGQTTVKIARAAAPFLRRAAASMLFNFGDIMKTSPEWRILRYQRVLSPEVSAYPIRDKTFVRPEDLRGHLIYLKTNYDVLPLVDLLDVVASKKAFPRKSVAITFDGGWADLYSNAFGMLRELKIPATAFLPTAFIGTMNMFWEDKFAAGLVFLKAAGHPLPRFSFLDDETFEELNNSGPVQGEINPVVLTALSTFMRVMDPEGRLQAIAELGSIIEKLGGLPIERQFLTWEEVEEMSKAGIVFGSLSHGYSSFIELEPQQAADDIRTSYETLASKGLPLLRAFAFPDGAVPAWAPELLAQLAIPVGLTIGNEPSVDYADGSFMVSRIAVGGESGNLPLFACRVAGVKVAGIDI